MKSKKLKMIQIKYFDIFPLFFFFSFFSHFYIPNILQIGRMRRLTNIVSRAKTKLKGVDHDITVTAKENKETINEINE